MTTLEGRSQKGGFKFETKYVQNDSPTKNIKTKDTCASCQKLKKMHAILNECFHLICKRCYLENKIPDNYEPNLSDSDDPEWTCMYTCEICMDISRLAYLLSEK